MKRKNIFLCLSFFYLKPSRFSAAPCSYFEHIFYKLFHVWTHIFRFESTIFTHENFLFCLSLRLQFQKFLNRIICLREKRPQYQVLCNRNHTAAGIAQSVVTRYGLDGPESCTMDNGSISREKRLGCGVEHPPSSSSDVKRKSRAIPLSPPMCFRGML
jgi:hypothetical protein